MGELAACQDLREDVPLSELISVSPGYMRGGFNLPSTVNMRARCLRITYAKLATLEAPRGWFNSSAAPRTSAGFPMTTYHMYHQTEGLLTLHRPFVGLVLSLTWQAGLVALRISMWLFDWATSGNVTAILAGIPGGAGRDAANEGGPGDAPVRDGPAAARRNRRVEAHPGTGSPTPQGLSYSPCWRSRSAGCC